LGCLDSIVGLSLLQITSAIERLFVIEYCGDRCVLNFVLLRLVAKKGERWEKTDNRIEIDDKRTIHVKFTLITCQLSFNDIFGSGRRVLAINNQS
jgi:hypothetical protein